MLAETSPLWTIRGAVTGELARMVRVVCTNRMVLPPMTGLVAMIHLGDHSRRS